MTKTNAATKFRATDAAKIRAAKNVKTSLPSLRLSLNKAATALLGDNDRLLIVVEDGKLNLKPSKRDDANVVTVSVRRQGSGTSEARLNQQKIARLAHLYGNGNVQALVATLTIGTKLNMASAPYRWLRPVAEDTAAKVSLIAA